MSDTFHIPLTADFTRQPHTLITSLFIGSCLTSKGIIRIVPVVEYKFDGI
ncbi:hypothetical protein H1R81_25405 [Emticicia sp. BO119]|nr:hypothetical protein [Emticicia sp. BO119]